MTSFNSNPLSLADQASYLKLTGASVLDPQAEGASLCPDWADSLTTARVALRDLDDAFPGSDAEKAVEAHKQLVAAANGLRMFLLLRGVQTLV
jgi:hypothetical protein